MILESSFNCSFRWHNKLFTQSVTAEMRAPLILSFWFLFGQAVENHFDLSYLSFLCFKNIAEEIWVLQSTNSPCFVLRTSTTKVNKYFHCLLYEHVIQTGFHCRSEWHWWNLLKAIDTVIMMCFRLCILFGWTRSDNAVLPSGRAQPTPCHGREHNILLPDVIVCPASLPVVTFC